MRNRRFGLIASLAGLGALAVLAACGGGNPASPSSEQGIVLRGSVTGSATAQSGGSSLAVVTVTVKEDPSITTTVGADGTFTLRGLPQEGFTLVFSNARGVIGTLKFKALAPNQEITITVSISSTSVTLLDERRNGIGHGDVEIEGKVSAMLPAIARNESRFRIAGYTVVARPGETAVRKGNSARTIADVTVGRQVHVKGVWLSMEGATQPVLAHEIKLQSSGSSPSPSPSPGNGGGSTQCVAPGAKAEVEGTIVGKGGSSITVFQQGKGNFLCQVGGGTRIRKGNTSYTFADLQSGWRVHVSGDGLGSSGGVCQVDAREIKVQQN
jgi:hypothetical protein